MAAIPVIIQPTTGLYAKQAVIISSFELKPEKKGIPAIAKQLMRKVILVIGMYLRRPPIIAISLLWTAWMIQPAPRNKQALNIAWVNKWNILAMKPSCA